MISAMLLISAMASAQTQDDPVIMTINGQPVLRSEFEYSYNKNNSEGVVDKKTVDEYVDLFINYKLKAVAAKEAKYDTLKTFKDEFKSYRDMQIRPSFITDDDVEAQAKQIYSETQHRIDSMGGLVKASHILMMARQTATPEEIARAKERADSLYGVLTKSPVTLEAFAEAAKTNSEDRGSAQRGGALGWVSKGQMLKEFEDVLFSLNKGEMSKPFQSPVGYHIIYVEDKGPFFPYDSLRTDIYRFIEQRGLRERIISENIEKEAKAANPAMTSEQLLDKRAEEMSAQDSDLKYLIQEYYDGLLIFEIANNKVYEKASKDDAALAKFFKKNKKKYNWDEPRFKGIAYHTRDLKDIAAVKQSVKKLPFESWNEKLHKTFNNDSILKIRVEKGIFKKGDNKLVDKEVFGVKTEVKPIKDYPYTSTFGKVLKAPKEYTDVKGQVVNDYSEYLMDEWVSELRKKYPVTVNKEVLATVNKH